MRNPLNKRFKRELISDFGKNLALFLFLTITIAFSAGFLVAGDSLIAAYDESFEKYNIEDGHFILSDKAPANLIKELEKQNLTVYELFFKNKTASDGDDIRVYKIREDVNKSDLMKGEMPKSYDEIVIDRLYAENNSIDIGDILTVAETDYTVTGYIALSDYSSLFKSNTSTMFDANKFSVALVTEEAFDAMSDGGLNYAYAYTFDDRDMNDSRAKKKSDKVLDKLITLVAEENGQEGIVQALTYMGLLPSVDNLTIEDFIARQDNQAITFTGEDFGGDRIMMEYLLYIVMGMLAFIFAVTTRSNIEKEAKAIGTLRASGFTRTEMLIHYLVVPTVITLMSALVGNIMGYTFVKNMVASLYYHSYSLPTYVTVWNADAFVKTTIVPCIIVITVEALVMYAVLKLSPLNFLRGEFKSKKKKKALRLHAGSFLTRFRARVIFQNKAAYVTIFIGILFANLMMTFGMIFVPLLDNFEELVKSSMVAKYQYVLTEPKATSTEGAEKYSMCSLQYNETEEISIYGISNNSEYFKDMLLTDTVGTSEDDDTVMVSSAFADKYSLDIDDEISLSEKYGNSVYDFVIKGIYDYPSSLCVYMPLNRFNETFDMEKSDYTGYYSDEEITDIKEEYIAKVITEHDLAVVAEQLDDSMGMMFPIFCGFAAMLYVLILYLLSKVIVERNERSISMMKILGFSNRETSAVYNAATAVVVVISMLLSIPLVEFMMHIIYKIMLTELSGYLPYYNPWWLYPTVLLIGLCGYLIVHIFQMRRIRRIPLAVALKDVE